MRISICIPAYHRTEMLRQALYSVLMQEHTQWEVIVRDDDPKAPVKADPEVDRLFKYLGNRLIYHIGAHLGTFSRVANETLKLATSNILYLMGSDDVLAPGALYSVNEAFEEEIEKKRGGPFWLYGKTVSADAHLRFQGEDGALTTLTALQAANRIGLPAVFWNRQMMSMAGPFDTRYQWAADYEMWLRFWAIREPLFLNRELGVYRHHDDQMSRTKVENLETEARNIALRHSKLGQIIRTARTKWLTQRAYDGESMPVSHDG